MIFYDSHGFAPDPRTCPACRETDLDILPDYREAIVGIFDLICPNCGHRGQWWLDQDASIEEREEFVRCHTVGDTVAYQRAMRQRDRLKEFRARYAREWGCGEYGGAQQAYESVNKGLMAFIEGSIEKATPAQKARVVKKTLGVVVPFAQPGPRLLPEQRERVTGSFDGLDMCLCRMIAESMLDG